MTIQPDYVSPISAVADLSHDGSGRAPVREVYIAIIGAGFGGLGAAIRLREVGIEDFVVIEGACDLGGTWRDNSYPGCACDVPAQVYSYSFAPSPEWTRV